MTRYLENQNLLHDCQNGFRKGRSTEDHLFVLNSELRKRMDNKESTYIAFIDFAKAFDTVNRDLLNYRLLKSVLVEKFTTLSRPCINIPCRR